MPPGRGLRRCEVLPPPYYSQRAVFFASLWALFSFRLISVLLISGIYWNQLVKADTAYVVFMFIFTAQHSDLYRNIKRAVDPLMSYFDCQWYILFFRPSKSSNWSYVDSILHVGCLCHKNRHCCSKVDESLTRSNCSLCFDDSLLSLILTDTISLLIVIVFVSVEFVFSPWNLIVYFL